MEFKKIQSYPFTDVEKHIISTLYGEDRRKYIRDLTAKYIRRLKIEDANGNKSKNSAETELDK